MDFHFDPIKVKDLIEKKAKREEKSQKPEKEISEYYKLQGVIDQVRKAMSEITELYGYAVDERSDTEYYLIGGGWDGKTNIKFTIKDNGAVVIYAMDRSSFTGIKSTKEDLGKVEMQGESVFSSAASADDTIYKWILNLVAKIEKDTDSPEKTEKLEMSNPPINEKALENARLQVKIAMDKIKNDHDHKFIDWLVKTRSENEWSVYNPKNHRLAQFRINPDQFRIEVYLLQDGQTTKDKGFADLQQLDILNWVEYKASEILSGDNKPAPAASFKKEDMNAGDEVTFQSVPFGDLFVGTIGSIPRIEDAVQVDYKIDGVRSTQLVYMDKIRKHKPAPAASFKKEDLKIGDDVRFKSPKTSITALAKIKSFSPLFKMNENLEVVYPSGTREIISVSDITEHRPAPASVLQTIAAPGLPMNFNAAYNAIVEALEKDSKVIEYADKFEVKLLMALLQDGFSVDVISKEFNEPNVVLLEKDGVELKVDDSYVDIRVLAIRHQSLAEIRKNLFTEAGLIEKVIKEANVKVANWK